MTRARLAAGACVIVAAGGVAVAVAALGGGSAPSQAGDAAGARATVPIERGALVARETETGTLGYARSAPLAAGASGTLTARPREGAVVRRGRSVYEVDGARTGWLLYGARPAWRDLRPGLDGDDVLQLERNLRHLGDDPDHAMVVDGDWDAGTTAALLRFQQDRDLTADATLTAGEIVFWPGPARVGDVAAERGTRLRTGTKLGTLSSTTRQVTVDLAADRQDLAHEDDRVTVSLPDGTDATGTITGVAKVATPPAKEGGDPTVEVTIRLRGRAARGTGLDQAPVEVGLVSERAKDVLRVPVSAILATATGYAVEVVASGTTRRVAVRLGLEADGQVAITGAGLREGAEVVVPS